MTKSEKGSVKDKKSFFMLFCVRFAHKKMGLFGDSLFDQAYDFLIRKVIKLGRKVKQMVSKEKQVVLIPAYKPQITLSTLSLELLHQGYNVVVIDDGSGEGYNHIFSELPLEVKVIMHSSNQGKGAALKTGLRYILENYPDSHGVITADADGQHLVSDIKKTGDRLYNTNNPIIIGGRRFDENVPMHNRLGNALTRWVFSLMTGVRIHDTQTGLRAFSMEILPALVGIPGDRYEYEMNVLLWAARNKVQMEEVEIRTVYLDDNSSSHFRIIRDSVLIYSKILKFGLSSIISFVIDFGMLFLIRSLSKGLGDALSLLVSATGARITSSTCNFTMNKRLVFKSEEKAGKEASQYFLLAGTMLLFNYSLLYLLNILMGWPLWTSKLTVEAVLFTSSYAIQKKVIFKEGRNQLQYLVGAGRGQK